MRDSFAHEECRLHLLGSDVLKDFWSKNGQWIGNHHNYNFADLRRSLTYMIRLEESQSISSRICQATSEAKEHLLPTVYTTSVYPNIGTGVKERKEGINFARRLARNCNVDGNNDNGDSGVEDCKQWFRHLFKFPSNLDVSDDNDTLLTLGDEDDVTVIGANISD
ncbi:hypothetical protein ACROYT_G015093 [Oculina patagonica]